jgi:hypothetical protein
MSDAQSNLPDQNDPDRPEGMVTSENMVPHDEDVVPGAAEDDEVDLSDDEDEDDDDEDDDDDDTAG